MTSKRAGLGKNLSALLSHSNTQSLHTPMGQDLLKVSIDTLCVGAFQPRQVFNEQHLEELAASIKEQGLLQPLVVRKKDHRSFEILAGERRFRACRMAGLTNIPVVVRQVNDETAMAIALVENMQREDLNALEQAKGMERLIHDFALTHQQVAQLLGKSRTSVSNQLRLLTLGAIAMRMLENGDIDMGHARALLALSVEKQNEIAQIVSAKGLSVRETELLVKRALVPEKEQSLTNLKALPPSLLTHSKTLESHLQTKVEVKHKKNGKGSLVIHFDSPTRLEAILAQLVD